MSKQRNRDKQATMQDWRNIAAVLAHCANRAHEMGQKNLRAAIRDCQEICAVKMADLE